VTHVHPDEPTNGICCLCGFSGEEECECPDSSDKIHCEHWFEGPDGDRTDTKMMSRKIPELTYLRAAIRAAGRVGLSGEFSEGYRSYRADGRGVQDAAWRALYDWDALDEIRVNGDGSVTLGLKLNVDNKEEVP
jgi:hypothetical protein